MMIFKKILAAMAMVFGFFALLALSISAFADAATDGVLLTAIQQHVSSSVVNLAKILTDVSLVAGIGFVLASFFKFHQHKLNPTQVPISQGITLLLIGAGLTVFPILVPTAKTAVFGPTAKVSQINGSAVTKIIGTAN